MEGEVRETLVSQGLGFLRAQTSSSLSERVQFLEGKGLSPAEVTEALARWRNVNGTPSKPPTSLLQWLMSYVVGPLAVVTTGLLVYNLSGGEEEFPQRQIEQDVQQQEQAPLGGQLVAGSDLVQLGVASGGSSLLLFPQEEDPPDWAKELHKLTLSLTEEMQLVRTKLDRLIAISESGRSAAADDEATSSITQQPDPEPPVTIECRLLNIREALCAMREASKSSIDPDAMKKCCVALAMYVTMLLEHPDTPRYRKIATSNDSFKSNVQPVEGHEKVLESIGFERRGLYYEWTWIQPPPSQAGTSSSPSTGVSAVDKESREHLLKWFIANLENLKQGADIEQLIVPAPPEGESDSYTEDSAVVISEDSGMVIPSFAEIAAQAKQGSGQVVCLDSVSITSETQGEK